MFWRAVVAFVAQPGLVAYAIPRLIRPESGRTPFVWIGLLPLAAGTLLLLLRVVFGEGPWLARRYGDEWQRYRARVPRWLF